MSQSFAESLSRVPKSRHLATTLGRAFDASKAYGHRVVSLEHLLLALIADSDASAVLQACHVDLGRLNGDVTGFLAGIEDRFPPGQGPDPVPTPDLIRILEYAAAAAQQSRRREINGAIVLAAIVGDGQSPAAQMMRAQGLTFEEAVKALQRSNAQPRPATPAEAVRPKPAPAPQPAPAQTRQPEARPQHPAAPVPPPYANGAPANPTEELLARARQRVQTGRRASAGEPAPEQETPPHHNYEPQPTPPEPEPAPAPQWQVEEAALAPEPHLPYGEQARYPEAPPQSEPAHYPPPQPDPYAQAAPPPGYPPVQNRQRPQPSVHPHRPLPAPWEGQLPSPSAAPGTRAAGRAGHAGEVAAPSGRGGRQGSPLLAGQLVENIPRTMKVGNPELVEVRIAKADVSALADGLQGAGAAYRHELVVTKAMSVRLRAPDGGFWIETASPETQWIENNLGPLSDDFASWRWNVTPNRSGKARLQLVVSARTVGTDGLAAETALPDRVINVKVRVNVKRTAAQWGGWVVAAVLGGILAKFGEGLWSFVQAIIGGTG